MKYYVAIMQIAKSDLAYLNKYFKILKKKTRVKYKVSYFKNLQRYKQHKLKYNLVFIGIDNNKGVVEAERFRTVNEIVPLILISDTAKLAICGYEVEAKGFLVKPFDYTIFQDTLLRILRLRTL